MCRQRCCAAGDDLVHVNTDKNAVAGGEVRRRADAYLKGGYGGLVGFELKGSMSRLGGALSTR